MFSATQHFQFLWSSGTQLIQNIRSMWTQALRFGKKKNSLKNLEASFPDTFFAEHEMSLEKLNRDGTTKAALTGRRSIQWHHFLSSNYCFVINGCGIGHGAINMDSNDVSLQFKFIWQIDYSLIALIQSIINRMNFVSSLSHCYIFGWIHYLGTSHNHVLKLIENRYSSIIIFLNQLIYRCDQFEQKSICFSFGSVIH